MHHLDFFKVSHKLRLSLIVFVSDLFVMMITKTVLCFLTVCFLIFLLWRWSQTLNWKCNLSVPRVTFRSANYFCISYCQTFVRRNLLKKSFYDNFNAKCFNISFSLRSFSNWNCTTTILNKSKGPKNLPQTVKTFSWNQISKNYDQSLWNNSKLEIYKHQRP